MTLLIPWKTVISVAVSWGLVGACCWESTRHYCLSDNTKCSSANTAKYLFCFPQSFENSSPMLCWLCSDASSHILPVACLWNKTSAITRVPPFPSALLTRYEKTSGKQEIPVEREGTSSARLWQLSWVVTHLPFLQGCSPCDGRVWGPPAFVWISGEAVAFAAGKLRLRRTEGCLGLHGMLVADKVIDPEFCLCIILSVTPHF